MSATRDRLASILSDMESIIAMVKRNLDADNPVVAVPVEELAKRSIDAVMAAKNYENARFAAWVAEGSQGK